MCHTPKREPWNWGSILLLLLLFTPQLAAGQGKVFWTEPENPAIMSSNFDGSSQVINVQGFALEWPVEIDVDQTTGWLYWADQGTYRVYRASPDGREGGAILPYSHAPYGIAVDGSNGYLYWTEKFAVKRGRLDASEAVDLVTDFDWPRALEIAVDDDLMFWTIASGGTYRSTLSGADVTKISDVGDEYLAVDPLHDEVFIPYGKKILRMTYAGASVDTVVYSDNYVHGITVEPAASRLCWSETVPVGPGDPPQPAAVVCSSTDGESPQKIAEVRGASLGLAINDQSRMIFMTTDRFPARLKRCRYDGSGLEDLASSMIWPVDVTVDPTAGKVYWVDAWYPGATLSRSDLDGRNSEDIDIDIDVDPLYGLDVLSAVAVDPINRNLYVGTEASVSLSSFSPGRIVMGPVEGPLETIIEDDEYENIWDIEVDVAHGKVYFVGRLGQLWRRNLDGSDPVQLKTSVGSGIAVSSKYLYWLDLDSRTLRRSNLDGTEETDVLADVDPIRDLAVDVNDRYLWWTTPGGESIKRYEIGTDVVHEMVNRGTPIEGLYVVSSPSSVLLLSPTAGALDQPTTLELTWSRPVDAQRFDLQVFSDANVNDVIYSANTPDAKATFVAPHAQSGYLWRVRSVGSGGTGPWTNLRGFSVGALGPLAATLLEPADGEAGVSIDPTLKWVAAPEAAIHRLQVAEDETFAVPLIDADSLSEEYVIAETLEHETTYYWRVAGLSEAGNYTFTAPRSFTTVVSAPQAVTLLSPSAGETGVSGLPTFTWEAVEAADTYHLQVSSDEQFSQLVLDAELAELSYASTTALTYDTEYYWRVRGANAGGEGAWSEERMFKTGVGTGTDSDGFPSDFALYPNYPNPFRVSSQIRYDLPQAEYVSIVVFDAVGRQLERLVDAPQPAGSHVVTFRAAGRPAGMYICRIRAGTFERAFSMVVVR